MPTKKQLLSALPPFKNDGVLINDFQSAKSIQREIIAAHNYFEADYDKIAGMFWTGDLYSTCNDIWDFLKYNFQYKAESVDLQSSRSPSRIVAANETLDCKHYSLFAGGVLDAIHRRYDSEFSWCYRFAGYKKPEIEHVFVVVDPDTEQEIWIDPVLSYFDVHDKPIYYKDSKLMALYRLSGIGSVQNEAGQTYQVDSEAAIKAFLTAVNLNLFGYRDLLKRNMVIVETQVKAMLSPVDYSILMNALNGK